MSKKKKVTKKKVTKKKTKEVVEKPWFEKLLSQPWYRGTDATGKGVGVAYMGQGFYVTWDKGIAEAFAQLSVEKTDEYPKKLHTYKIKPGLKLLDNMSEIMFGIKADMGVSPWDKISTPSFAFYLAMEVKNAGYDGVIDDTATNGMVLFDGSNAIKIDEIDF